MTVSMQFDECENDALPPACLRDRFMCGSSMQKHESNEATSSSLCVRQRFRAATPPAHRR
eukprot:COSAG01_NODE_4928_length_4613_cov_24.277741_8_plen_60_part_00